MTAGTGAGGERSSRERAPPSKRSPTMWSRQLYFNRATPLGPATKMRTHLVQGRAVHDGLHLQEHGQRSLARRHGSGENMGSDIKLVAYRGRPDPMTGKTFLSVEDNKNDWVRADRDAGNCSTGSCRRPGVTEGLWRSRRRPGTSPMLRAGVCADFSRMGATSRWPLRSFDLPSWTHGIRRRARRATTGPTPGPASETTAKTSPSRSAGRRVISVTTTRIVARWVR
jgi:hypothetical protein